MGKAITALTLGSALVAAGCAAEPAAHGELSAEDIAALEHLAETDARIVLARDWATLAARFAPDAVRMPPNEPAIRGRAAIRESLEMMPPISSFSFRMTSLDGAAGFAYMRARWSMALAPTGTGAVTDSGKILIVFEKQADGSWLRVADAWNSDLPIVN